MRIQRKNTNRLQISDAYLKIFLGRRGPYIEYLKGIFGYFRKNFMEMLSEKDYKRLYDEIIEYLLYDLKLCDNEENRHKYEQDFDALENSICRKEEFDLFFGGRKALWKIVGLY